MLYTTSATELKYASGSSWTSGRARQGVYSGTRYEGAIRFPGVASLNFGNIAISQINLKLKFSAAGGDSTKHVTLYEGAKNTISGSIAEMRGASIGAITVANAYSTTKTLTFTGTTNAAIFTKMRDHFASGGQVLILYVPTTRGTYSGGYCYDYLSVESAEITLTYEYMKSDGTHPTSVNAGSVATLYITAYNSAYTHKVSWMFGSYAHTETADAGLKSVSYQIPLDWLKAIPDKNSGQASVSLETIDTSGTALGLYTYNYTITVPSSVVPTINDLTASPVNDNPVIAGWGIFVQGKSKANIAIAGASGAYGSNIDTYSIVTTPSIASSKAATLQTGVISVPGTITVTATVTDTRGRTAKKMATFSVYPYAAPTITLNDAYRATSEGVRADDSGTFARIRATFGCADLGTGRNSVTVNVTIRQNGGSYSETAVLANGEGVTLGGGSLATDATYTAAFTVTDTVGTTTPYTATINSIAYILHVKKGGTALGIGMAAGADQTASFGWPLLFGDAASRVASAQNILFLGTDLDFPDTTANWSARGFGWAWCTDAGTPAVTNKPAAYGFLLNVPVPGVNEAHQLFLVQNHGSIWHRGGNHTGWGAAWKRVFDNADVVGLANGGTGVTTAAAIRNLIGLGNTIGLLGYQYGGLNSNSLAQAQSNLGIAASSTTTPAVASVLGTLEYFKLYKLGKMVTFNMRYSTGMVAGGNTEAAIIPSAYRSADAYVPLSTYYGSNTISIDAYTTNTGILMIRPSANVNNVALSGSWATA